MGCWNFTSELHISICMYWKHIEPKNIYGNLESNNLKTQRFAFSSHEVQVEVEALFWDMDFQKQPSLSP